MAPAPKSTKMLTAASNGTVIQQSTTNPESLKLTSASTKNTFSNDVSSLKLSNDKVSSKMTLNGGLESSSHEDQKKRLNSCVSWDKTIIDSKTTRKGEEPLQLVWRNVIIFIYLHSAALYGAYLWVTGQVLWHTFLWALLFYCMSGFGITGGAHRYWAHKSFKAKTPLRILLAVMQTVAYQNSIHEWCRDHRNHHKFSETNADPHNARRGFFYAHMGWLMCRKHKDVKEQGKLIDMSDLEADPIVMFQKRHYVPLALTASFFIPTLVPWFFWGESLGTAWFFAAQFRYCITLHMTWLVNSAAHMWGFRPYDKSIHPAENKTIAFLAFGEGWHNYHHVFPWDYKTAEIGQYGYNFTAAFIDFFAWIGWAYDLKTVSHKVVIQRMIRTGDGTHSEANGHSVVIDEHQHEPGPWGWGDVDIPSKDIAVTETLYSQKED